MSTRFETRPDEQVQQTPEPARGGWQATVQTLLAIFGAIAVFLGLFILYGPEGQSLGFGGDWSWEVGTDRRKNGLPRLCVPSPGKPIGSAMQTPRSNGGPSPMYQTPPADTLRL